MKVSSNSLSHVCVFLQQGIDKYSFDTFHLNIVSKGSPLRYMGYKLLSGYGCLHKYKVSRSNLFVKTNSSSSPKNPINSAFQHSSFYCHILVPITALIDHTSHPITWFCCRFLQLRWNLCLVWWKLVTKKMGTPTTITCTHVMSFKPFTTFSTRQDFG